MESWGTKKIEETHPFLKVFGYRVEVLRHACNSEFTYGMDELSGRDQPIDCFFGKEESALNQKESQGRDRFSSIVSSRMLGCLWLAGFM